MRLPLRDQTEATAGATERYCRDGSATSPSAEQPIAVERATLQRVMRRDHMLTIGRGVPLAPMTTMRIGGAASAFAEVTSLDELKLALRWAADEGLPYRVIGYGSNLLVSDDGVDALVLKLTDGLAAVRVIGETMVAGGGAMNGKCLAVAIDRELAGFEFACGIPGTAGGGLRMNAGIDESDWSMIVERALVVSRGGHEWRGVESFSLDYRSSNISREEIIAKVVFKLRRAQGREDLRAEVARFIQKRRDAQHPTDRLTFGSTFKNPKSAPSAGRMLDACGLKGFAVGGARISPRHANFIENHAGGTAREVLALVTEAQRRASGQGIVLEPEVELWGNTPPFS